ncbi:STAS domain-containing protein [Novispirillum sp. DQ9]|uniref:STAS domain-containing protein n=1 Tax=Novispirillum sp. DQ9 TaxID=3398612 RepID=UPI003C7DD90B
MTVEVSTRDGAQVVTLSGEIDLQTSPQVRDAVLGSLRQGGPVVVDMGGIAYIDSSGVASLVEGFQVARRQGVAFVLAAVSPAAMRVLQLARLDKVFAFQPDVDSALRDGI